MKEHPENAAEWLALVEDLKARLADSEETLHAITTGEVDAVIVSGASGKQVFTLHGAEHVFRCMIEEMDQGALTLTDEGTILYCNRAFAEMIQAPMDKVIGESLGTLFSSEDPALNALVVGRSQQQATGEFNFPRGNADPLPIRISVSPLAYCSASKFAIVTNLSDHKTREKELLRIRDELDTRVIERTRSLVKANQELEASEVAALNMMQDAVRAKKELELAQGQLLNLARDAGRADVASSVLHNVGNVLNSVTVSANQVRAKVQKLNPASLKLVINLLQKHSGDLPDFLVHDPQGRLLPEYLLSFAEHMAEPQKEILTEISHLEKSIHHVVKIINMQQTHTRRGGMIETVSLQELIEDALLISRAQYPGIQINRDYAKLPPVRTDRHKVLQILINLVTNACFALNRNQPDKSITLGTALEEKFAVVSVRDNGVGIPPENLSKIFGFGFTTRPDGHGFGLHSGALAARELGGTLTAHSEGLGQGALFTLRLPLRQPPNPISI